MPPIGLTTLTQPQAWAIFDKYELQLDQRGLWSPLPGPEQNAFYHESVELQVLINTIGAKGTHYRRDSLCYDESTLVCWKSITHAHPKDSRMLVDAKHALRDAIYEVMAPKQYYASVAVKTGDVISR